MAEIKNVEDEKEEVLLQVRIQRADKTLIEELANLYGINVKSFVPLAAKYIKQELPTLELSPQSLEANCALTGANNQITTLV